jgi:8-oxo-dGTP pyrophosphatase MutT (NUDIX family)
MRLTDSLERHLAADALEAHHLDIIRTFVAAHPDPFDRTISEGHCTGSAFILSATGDALLMVYHRKLGCWLQPGGHGDPGETTGEAVAAREAREETGVDGLVFHPAAPRPLDVDVHRIPAFEGVAAHDHLDLRYLMVAPEHAPVRPSTDETSGAQWFSWEALEALGLDQPTRRAVRKIRRIVDGSPRG